MLSFTTAIRGTYQPWALLPLLLIFLLYRTITRMKMWPAQFAALLSLLFHSLVKTPIPPQNGSTNFSSTACKIYHLAVSMPHFFLASIIPFLAPAARGNGTTQQDLNVALVAHMDGWLAICHLFTLYVSLLSCCDHPCPG